MTKVSPYAQDERFAHYLGQEADLSMPTPALSRVEVVRWAMDAALKLDRWCDYLDGLGLAVDARARDAAEQVIAALPVYNSDIWCLADGRMACSATREQLLRTLGWPSRAGERLSRAVRLLCLQQAPRHCQRTAARLNAQVDALVAADAEPILALVKPYKPNVRGAVYTYVGADAVEVLTQDAWDAVGAEDDVYDDDWPAPATPQESADVVAAAAPSAAEVVTSKVTETPQEQAPAPETPQEQAPAPETPQEPQESADDAVYQRFVSRWPYGAGTKADETLKAWRTRVAQGYDADAMDAAAAAYNEDRSAAGPSGKPKAVYPLIWLTSEDFKAAVPAAPRRMADPDAAAMVADAIERRRVQLVSERGRTTAVASVSTPWAAKWFGPIKTPIKTLQVTAVVANGATIEDARGPLTSELERMLADERRLHGAAA